MTGRKVLEWTPNVTASEAARPLATGHLRRLWGAPVFYSGRPTADKI